VSSGTARRDSLKALYEEARGCTRCAELAATRQTVVFGAGNADADLMFVGEAPGATEDKLGLPFVGQAGKLLEKLLGEIGIARADVFIANVLKCRPPGNRDPEPGEIENCRSYLSRQVELIEPRVICSLGNFATKLLRDDPTGITRIHGRPEVRRIGSRAVRIFPIFHPAAALYNPRTLETLRADFSRLPAILALEPPPALAPATRPATRIPADRPAAPAPPAAAASGASAPKAPPPSARTSREPDQLGLFE
jgi:uracil-DNA glycosylase